MNSKILNILKNQRLVRTMADWNTSSASQLKSKASTIIYSPLTSIEFVNHAVFYGGKLSEKQINAYDNDGNIIDEANALSDDQALELLALAQRAQGSYHILAKRGVNHVPEGQAIAQMKTWLFDTINEHLGPEGKDMFRYRKGILRSIPPGLSAAKDWIYGMAKMDPDKAMATWNSLHPVDQGNIIRLMREGLMMSIFGMLMAGFADDDEAYRKLRKMTGDVTFVLDINNWQMLMKSPIPIFSTFIDMLELSKQTLLTGMGFGEVYKREGSFGDKGDSKLPAYVVKIAPFKNVINSTLANEQ